MLTDDNFDSNYVKFEMVGAGNSAMPKKKLLIKITKNTNLKL